MTVNAKCSDSLNEILNTQSEDRLVVILPSNAVFREKVKINRSNVVVIGNGSSLVFDDYNSKYEGMGTADSATLTVNSGNVLIRDFTVVNDYDFATEPHQAVAVFIAPGCDQVVFDTCTLKGHQDTLFADGERNLFLDCTIEGCVDFIFGRATADFNNCNIISNGEGYVCAPSTMEDCEMGFSFMDCSFTASDGVPDSSVFLARPWHPSGKPGVSSFMFVSNCKLGKHVNMKLWTSMKDSKGVLHTPQESRFIIDEQSLA